MKRRVLFLTTALILAISVIFGGCTSKTDDSGDNTGNNVTQTADNGNNGSSALQNTDNNGAGSDSNSNAGAGTDQNASANNNAGNDNNSAADNSPAGQDDQGAAANNTNNDNTATGSNQNTDDSDGETDYSLLVPTYATGEYKKKDLKSSFNPDKATKIVFNGSSISVDGEGAEVNGNKVTISLKGTYLVSGTLDDGQIIVNAGDEDDVRLILNGATMNCSNSSCIYALNADKVILTLVDGSVNTFTDTSNYVYDNPDKEEPNAAIFTDCDLSINGNGTLNVNGNFQHAIRVKADVKITSGTINLSAVEKGLKVKKTFAILDGTLNIKSGDDGINAGMTISLDGGTINVTAEDDAIQSDEQIIVNAGTIDTSKSKKGFKAPLFTPNGGDIS